MQFICIYQKMSQEAEIKTFGTYHRKYMYKKVDEPTEETCNAESGIKNMIDIYKGQGYGASYEKSSEKDPDSCNAKNGELYCNRLYLLLFPSNLKISM